MCLAKRRLDALGRLGAGEDEPGIARALRERDKVLPRMAGYKGHVLKTSLPEDREKRLREALGDTAPA